MRLRFVILLWIGSSVAMGACSLNPQPLPPDTNDASVLNADAGKGGMPDSSTTLADAAAPEPEAGVEDASDADAADATADATFDATTDADDASDANEEE